MPRDPQATREKILAAGNELILKQGFAATSLDQILERAAVTKGAFFHHFENKAALGEALMARFVREDRALLDSIFARAEALSSDPLQQVLVALGLLQEMFQGLAEPPPGCLIAAYCYQEELMTEAARRASAAELLLWRERIAAKLREAAKTKAPRADVDLEGVADLLNTIIEGAFVMSKTLGDPALVAGQIGQFRAYLTLLFGVPQVAAARPTHQAAGPTAGPPR